MPDVWDKQEDRGETSKAYEAFSAYRDLGSARSVDKAFQQHQNSTKTAPRHWMQWAIDFEWTARAKAYDAYIELQVRKQDEQKHVEELVAYRERARKAAETTFTIANAAMQIAGQKLQQMVRDKEDIGSGNLPSLLRAAAAVMETSLNAEAEAIGVRRLESLLDDADKDESEG